MQLINLINTVLNHVGEQGLVTSAGTLGALTKTAIQTALTKVVQETRATYFEQIYTMTATNEDYTVAAGLLSSQIAQVYSVRWKQTDSPTHTFIEMPEQPFARLDVLFGYSLVGNQLFVTNLLARPIDLQIHALVIPILPSSDSDEVSVPEQLLPAVIHQAASILLVTYVDDANAASIQQRMADTLITIARGQLGVTRGRHFSLSGSRWF